MLLIPCEWFVAWLALAASAGLGWGALLARREHAARRPDLGHPVRDWYGREGGR